MHIFHFGNHSISLSDIRDIKLQYDYQKNEISKIEWKTLEECLENIRFYHFEKKQLILNIVNYSTSKY